MSAQEHTVRVPLSVEAAVHAHLRFCTGACLRACVRARASARVARAAQPDETLLLMHVHEAALEVTPTPTPLTPTSVGGFHRSESGTPPSTLGCFKDRGREGIQIFKICPEI